jgi:sn-glycerol 3-phosphate transport system substrate-binding protein
MCKASRMNLHRNLRVGIGAAIAVSTLTTVSFVQLSALPASAATKCASTALPKTGKVKITFWEGMTSANQTEIVNIVNAFNKSQTKVQVTVKDQTGGYPQTWSEYLSSLGRSSEPNVVMLDQYITQGAVDSKSIIPIATCVAGTHYSTKAYSPKPIGEETVGGTLQGLPYSVSAPILIYNKNSFAGAHISGAPSTLAEMATDAAALKGSSYKYKGKTYKNTDGMTLKLDPWYLQILQGVGNDYFVNNENGRMGGRATAAAFNDSIGLSVFTQLQDIVKAGDAVTNPATGSIATAYANLFAIAFGKSGMSIDSSATLGTILGDLHLYPNVSLGVAEMPNLSSTPTGGVQPGGNALFIPSQSNSSAAKLAASWEFIQYLDSATEMATWDAATGYVPIRSDAASNAIMKAFWKKYPALKAAYNEISKGVVDNATEGPLLGDYYTVNNDIATYENDLLSSPYPSPATVLSEAATQVTSDIQTYNTSIGQ